MLKNKTKLAVPVKYNGRIIKILAGKSIDVRDFDVANADVKNVEKGLIIKYPGKFESVKGSGDPEIDRETANQISALEEKLAEGEKVIIELRESNSNLAENVETSSGELQVEKERADSLKKEADDATAALKESEDEVEKLRLQISENKENKEAKKDNEGK